MEENCIRNSAECFVSGPLIARAKLKIENEDTLLSNCFWAKYVCSVQNIMYNMDAIVASVTNAIEWWCYLYVFAYEVSSLGCL